MAPRVTIGLPVYNGERYLEQALASVLGQTYHDIELLISDNASDDRTEEICRSAAADDPRVSYQRLPRNLGAAPNYNRLVAMARGELFKWAAHDDLLAPTYLERCVAALDAEPRAVLAFTRTRNIDADGATIEDLFDPPPPGGPSERFAAMLAGDGTFRRRMVSAVVGLIRTDPLRRTALIGSYQSSDQVLATELALLGPFAQVPEHLFMRRWHDANSWAAGMTPEQVRAWFDARRTAAPATPRISMLRGFAGAVRRAPLPPRERLRCARELGAWAVRDGMWRRIGGEAKIALRSRIAARSGSSAATAASR